MYIMRSMVMKTLLRCFKSIFQENAQKLADHEKYLSIQMMELGESLI